jgi:hypothetical protein
LSSHVVKSVLEDILQITLLLESLVVHESVIMPSPEKQEEPLKNMSYPREEA